MLMRLTHEFNSLLNIYFYLFNHLFCLHQLIIIVSVIANITQNLQTIVYFLTSDVRVGCFFIAYTLNTVLYRLHILQHRSCVQ